MGNTTFLENNPSKGLGLGFAGGLALSFDIPLIRLAGSDPFMVMGARGLGIALILWLYARFIADRSAMPKDPLSDWTFLTVGALSGANNVFFTLAVFHTSTANVVFILAFNAMLAALLSWPLTGERPGLPTWMAIIATMIGVTIIVADGIGAGNAAGDLMALLCAALLALSLTLTRRSGKDLSLAPGYGGLISAAFALPMILWASSLPAAPGWLIFDAVVLVPIAGITLWLAPRFIPAPQVALFYLLETVLAPLWVWFVFNEKPSGNVVFGGSIVVLALTVHALWELRRSKQPEQTMLSALHTQDSWPVNEFR